MNTCNTCQYWSKFKIGEAGECLKIEQSFDSIDKEEIPDSQPKVSVFAQVKCLTAYLSTPSDFGCNQWEAK